MQLTLNNRRRCLNLVCPLLLLIPQRISQFLVQFVPVVGFFKIHIIVIFSQKHDSQYATELPLQPVYTLVVFKHRTLHREVVYPHQSIFRALEEGDHITSRSSRHFVTTDQNKLFVRMTKIKNLPNSG